MKLLITGGAGFIGSETVRVAVRNHHRVTVVDDFSTGKLENLSGVRCVTQPCDVTDRAMLERVFDEFKPDAVIHLAAQSAITTSMKDPQKDALTNIIGTINLLGLSEKHGVRRFVFASTSAVYDSARVPIFGYRENSPCNPSSPYGIGKMAAEQYVRELFPNHVIFRYGNVYGPRQIPIGENQVIARALSHFVSGHDFHIVGHGRQKRDFVYVSDVAHLNVEAAEYTSSAMTGTYNLATGRSHSVNEALAYIEDLYGVTGYNWGHSKQNDPRGDVYIHNGKIRRDFGFAFMPFRDGLNNTVDWRNQEKGN